MTQGQNVSMQTTNLVTADGISLVHRVFTPADKTSRVAFVAHSQAQHTLNLRPTIEGVAARGWQVHGTDLRGHGYSSGARAPRAHMDMNEGWERLVSDLKLGLETAFAKTAWEDRMIVAPNIGATLVLEILKDWPDLARSIVFITPPPNQPIIWRLARSFMQARAKMHPEDAPDELTMHQLYTFLSARLNDRKRLIDVISSDPAITDELLQDPYAWPTPTTGYFHEIFRGIPNAWRWPQGSQVADGMRILLLYGGDDPMTANGKFVAPMQRHFETMNITDVTSHCFEKGRAGLFIEERRLGISQVIHHWYEGEALSSRDNENVSIADISSNVLSQLGLDPNAGDLSEDALVELCYGAIDDESRWVEMLYRFTYALSSHATPNDETLDRMVTALMPHWDRSYQLNRQIMQSATIGAVLQNVIERFDIGMAVISSDMDVKFANSHFARVISELSGENVDDSDLPALTKAIAELSDRDFAQACATGHGEALFMVDGQAVGLHFRPKALRQTALQIGGPSGVLILRPANQIGTTAEKTELLRFAYGLTEKEAEAALGLLDGLSPNEIAARDTVSINTTRTHLKRIYEKVGAKGQHDLTARLLKGPLGLIVNG
ncbi:serine aminopeptidase domain-containing protein [Jannaschia aquimarina]|nr:alpha/beta hydrolase [Jannaschia aquimarina]